MQVDNDTTIVVADEVTRVLHQEPGTPFVTGGFDSSAMASPEARSDQSRGSVHVHSMDARLRDGIFLSTIIYRLPSNDHVSIIYHLSSTI